MTHDSDAIRSALLAARLARPYYARALAALTPVAVPGLGTVAVDRYWRLYADPVWLAALPITQQAMVIGGHEIEHLLRRHPARGAVLNAHPQAVNVAGDAEINDDLPAGSLPDGCVLPATIGCRDGGTLEEYLRHLLDQDSARQHGDPKCGSGSGGAALPCEQGEPGDGRDPGLTEAEGEIVRRQTAHDVVNHARQNPGTVPAGVLMWAEEAILPIPYDWRRALASAVGRAAREVVRGRSDYSWARLSRRARPGVPLRPGMTRHVPRIGLVVDVSGSMGGDGALVLGAVESIARAAGSLSVVTCDAAVNAIRHGVRTARGMEWRGGGGTDLRPAIEMAAKCSDVVLVVTDCETPWPESALSVPVIVAAISDAATPEWATRIRIGGER